MRATHRDEPIFGAVRRFDHASEIFLGGPPGRWRVVEGTRSPLGLFDFVTFMFSADRPVADPPGLILSATEAARQRAGIELERLRAGVTARTLLLRKW